MNGIINVYKEKGFTSHDVVAKLRGILRQKKIGHTGTLDPDATGVLPVCLGNATKLCDMLTDKNKTYQAVLKLGIVTDTQDMTGEIQEEKIVSVTKEEVESTILSFIGDYEQIPPMYSALKVNGKKLYELAREGKVIERKARLVHILDIQIQNIDMEQHEIIMLVSCSKGTYIRTLCHDIGEKLGCGGCMKSLLRTKVGAFTIEDSLKLEEIEELHKTNNLDSYLVKPDEVFKDYAGIIVKDSADRLLYNGNAFQKRNVAEILEGNQEQYRVYDSKNVFVGVYIWSEERQVYKPVKMFLS